MHPATLNHGGKYIPPQLRDEIWVWRLCRCIFYSSLLLPVERKTAAFIFVLRNPKTVHQSDCEFGITVTMQYQVRIIYSSIVHSINVILFGIHSVESCGPGCFGANHCTSKWLEVQRCHRPVCSGNGREDRKVYHQAERRPV